MTITAKNYAAQCARSLRRIGPRSLDPEQLLAYASLIENAQHFALPDGGRLFDDNLKGFKHGEAAVEPPRLPFPVVTAEYSFAPSEHAAREKRLVLLVERAAFPWAHFPLEAYTSQHAGVINAMSFLVLGFTERWVSDTECGWLPNFVGAMVTGHTWPLLAQTRDDPTTPGSFIFWEGTLNFPALTKAFVKSVKAYGSDEDQVAATTLNVRRDSAPEVRAGLDFLEAMSCVNISTAIHQAAPSNKVAHARRRDGKAPIYETKMLVVDVRGDGAPRAIGAPRGPSEGVRQHLRRGHIRRLQSGRNIWVNSHVVGDPSLGRIDKQYELRA